MLIKDAQPRLFQGWNGLSDCGGGRGGVRPAPAPHSLLAGAEPGAWSSTLGRQPPLLWSSAPGSGQLDPLGSPEETDGPLNSVIGEGLMKRGFPGVGRLMGIQEGLERPPGLATWGVTTSLPQGQGREQMQTPERELEGEGFWGGRASAEGARPRPPTCHSVGKKWVTGDDLPLFHGHRLPQGLSWPSPARSRGKTGH